MRLIWALDNLRDEDSAIGASDERVLLFVGRSSTAVFGWDGGTFIRSSVESPLGTTNCWVPDGIDGMETVPDNGSEAFFVRCNRHPNLTSAVGASPNFRAQLVGREIFERNNVC